MFNERRKQSKLKMMLTKSNCHLVKLTDADACRDMCARGYCWCPIIDWRLRPFCCPSCRRFPAAPPAANNAARLLWCCRPAPPCCNGREGNPFAPPVIPINADASPEFCLWIWPCNMCNAPNLCRSPMSICCPPWPARACQGCCMACWAA